MSQPREHGAGDRGQAGPGVVITFLAILAICAAVAFVTQRATRVWGEATPTLAIR